MAPREAWAGGLQLPELLKESPAHYPEELERAALEGEVTLELLVDVNGEVEQSRVKHSDHPRFSHAALEASLRLLFHPALLDEKPTPVLLQYIYRFVAPSEGLLVGQVLHRETKRPVARATVWSEDGRSVEADDEGRFQLRLAPGRRNIFAGGPGLVRGQFVESVERAQRLEVVYSLSAEAQRAAETVVHRTVERVDRLELSRVSVEARELAEVPGTMGDPFRAVMALPGVSSIASGIPYPVVRGTSPAGTAFYLDGVRVPILFHLFLGPAVVHPDMIESIDFYPGLLPAQFGRALGGAVSSKLRSALEPARPDDRERTRGSSRPALSSEAGRSAGLGTAQALPGPTGLKASAYADFIHAGLFVQSPLGQAGTGVTAAGRFSYTPWLVNRTSELLGSVGPQKLKLDYYDYQARLEQRLGSGSVRLFAFGSSDVASTFVAQDTHSILFHRVDLSARQRVGPGDFEVAGTWGLDRLAHRGDDGEGATSLFSLDTRSWAARSHWESRLGRHVALRIGADVERRQAGRRQESSRPEALDGSYLLSAAQAVPLARVGAAAMTPQGEAVATGTFSGAFAELTLRPTHDWTIAPVLRVDDYRLRDGGDWQAFEPRLAVRHHLSREVTLKAGAGVFHQPPSTLISLPVMDLAHLSYGLQRSVQSETGVEWRSPLGFELGADVYFNRLTRTVELSPFDGALLDGLDVDPRVARNLSSTAPEPVSNGYAYGLEVLLRRAATERWFGWLSYTLQRSSRLTRFARTDAYGLEVGDLEAYLPFSLDQTHVLNGVVSFRLGGGWSVGASAHLNSGRPETGGLTSMTRRRGVSVLGDPEWIAVDRDGAERLPGFVRVDSRIAHTLAVDTFTVEAYLDLFNVTLSREVVRYLYLNDGDKLSKVGESSLVALPVLGIKGAY